MGDGSRTLTRRPPGRSEPRNTRGGGRTLSPTSCPLMSHTLFWLTCWHACTHARTHTKGSVLLTCLWYQQLLTQSSTCVQEALDSIKSLLTLFGFSQYSYLLRKWLNMINPKVKIHFANYSKTQTSKFQKKIFFKFLLLWMCMYVHVHLYVWVCAQVWRCQEAKMGRETLCSWSYRLLWAS